MENEALIERVADLIEQQVDLDLDERQAETLRASAFLAVTEIEGVTSAIFAEAASRVYVSMSAHAKQGYRNRYNESAKIWGEDFRFGG
jgi:hypothetical protein